jgi:hypothetical protein
MPPQQAQRLLDVVDDSLDFRAHSSGPLIERLM